MTRRLALCAATIALAAGCAAEPAEGPGFAGPGSSSSSAASPSSVAPSSSSAAAPSSSVAPPSSADPSSPAIDRRPSGPPNGPTDQLKKTSWVVGTVTAGGSGPCYGLETDEGTQYALHATDGTTLVKGARMRIKTQTARVRIDCGPGRLVEMVAAEAVR